MERLVSVEADPAVIGVDVSAVMAEGIGVAFHVAVKRTPQMSNSIVIGL